MSGARRTALFSLGAALALALGKLAVGLATGSLGILAEAAHSGVDAAAALLTFYAVSVAERPADRGPPLRARQGAAPLGAGGGGDPRRRSRAGSVRGRLRLGDGAHPRRRDLVRLRVPRRRAGGRRGARGRLAARSAQLRAAPRCGATPAHFAATSPARSPCIAGLALTSARARRRRRDRGHLRRRASCCSAAVRLAARNVERAHGPARRRACRGDRARSAGGVPGRERGASRARARGRRAGTSPTS